jgi:hypothetical protein
VTAAEAGHARDAGEHIAERALERQPAGEQLIENDAKRVDVRGGPRLLTVDLLRGHVRRRAEDLAALA